MADSLRPSPPTRFRRRLSPVTTLAGEVLGTTVDAAVPLHSHHPALVLGTGTAEILLFVVLVLTGSVVVLAGLVVAVTAYVAFHLTDRRAVLARTAQGDVLLAAGRNGRPRSVLQPLPTMALPPASGVAAPVEAGGRRWWVDRSAYPLLRQAAALRPPR